MRKGKLRLLLTVVLAMSLLAAGCAGTANQSKAPNQDKEIPTLTVCYQFGNHHTPFVAAMYKGEDLKDLGYHLKEVVPKEKFELFSGDEKIANLNIVVGKSGAEVAVLFAQKHIDVGLGSVTAMLSGIDRGTPIKILSPIQTEGIGVVFPKGSPVKDWDSFVKYTNESSTPVKIGYHSPTSAPKMVLESSLHEAGFKITEDANDSSADILLVDLKEMANLVPALSSKQVEGWVGPAPYPAVAVEQGIGQIIFEVRDLPPAGKWHDTPCCVVAAREQVISDYENEVRVLVELIGKYGEWCNNNMDEAAKITSEWMGLSEKAARESVITYTTNPSETWKNGIGVYIATLNRMGKYEGELKDKELKDVEDLLFDFRFVE